MLEYVSPAAYVDPSRLAYDHLQSIGAPADVRLTQLSPGNHNAVFLCENGPPDLPGRFVVRIPLCPEATRMCMLAAASLMNVPAAPQIFWGKGDPVLSDPPILLEEYFDGEARDLSELTPAQINTLAVTLAAVHSHKSRYFSQESGKSPRGIGTYRDYLGAMVMESVTNRLMVINLERYPGVERLIMRGLRRMWRLVDASADSFMISDHSLLHHDLSKGNVLWSPDETVGLVDWNITYGDPADDISYLVTDNRLSHDFAEQFRAIYIEKTGRTDIRERIGAYTLKNLMDDLAWVIMMQQRFPGDPRYDENAYTQRVEALNAALAA